MTMRELPSPSNDGEMRDQEDVQDLRDQHSTRFDITQIQNMNKLVELHLSELEEDDNRAAGYGPILRDKELLESLSLSWKNAKKGLHSETAKNMLEILEPYKAVKKLYIQRYSSDSLPIWFATSAANLQVLSLKGFEELQKLPSLTRLTKLTKLVMVNMQKIIEVFILFSLEKLTMCEMPKLERCSCNSLRSFNSTLRVLEIRKCPQLKSFPLFEYYRQIKDQQGSWMPRLATLLIDGCPNLMVSCPLPSSEVTDVYTLLEFQFIPICLCHQVRN